MFIKNYISKDYPAFGMADSVEEAAEIAKDFGYSHIFIKKKGAFCGALSQAFLEESPEGNLGALEQHFEKFAVKEDSDMLDSIKLFHTFSSNIVPVIGQNEKYLGYISSEDIFAEFSKYPLFSENGAVLTVSVSPQKYSFSEISQIVESNNGKIYGLFINSVTDTELEITLKISNENLTSITETFERYGYFVVHKSYADEKAELLKDRFGFLQKYIEF